MANLPLSHMLDSLPWRTTMLILAGIMSVISAGIWIVLRDKPVQQTETPSTSWKQHTQSLSLLLKNPTVLKIAMYGGLMYTPLSVFADAWSISFLAQRNNISLSCAAQLSTVFLLGSSIGSVGLPFIASRWLQNNYALCMRASAFVSIWVYGILVFTTWGSESWPLSFFLVLAAGIAFTGQILVFAYSYQFVSVHVEGALTGVINSLVMFSGAMIQPLVGSLISYAQKTYGYSATVIPLAHYQVALAILPVSMLAAFLVSMSFPAFASEKKRAFQN